VILEMKQQAVSAITLGNPGGLPASAYGNHEGQRVAMTLKAQLSNADVLVADITDTYHAEFRAEVLAFAKDYAQQVKYDYQAFLAALAAGQPLY
jgi:uncharacterized protein (DUF2252 family)